MIKFLEWKVRDQYVQHTPLFGEGGWEKTTRKMNILLSQTDLGIKDTLCKTHMNMKRSTRGYSFYLIYAMS